MNNQNDSDQDREGSDLKWLSQQATDIGEKQECYFCNTIRNALAQGWSILDARYYALGKIMGKQFW